MEHLTMEANSGEQTIEAADKKGRGIPFLIVLLVFVTMFFASTQLPPTRDECITFERAENVEQWFSALLSGKSLPGGHSPLSREGIAEHWIFTNVLDGHPAGYTILVAAGHKLCQLFPENMMSLLSQYRFGDLLLFAIACGFCFRRLRKLYGNAVAWLGILSLLCIPRLFAHCQIAACDSPIVSCWILAWALFNDGLSGKKGALFWGLALGLGFSCKFTGWCIPAPFVFYAIIRVFRGHSIREYVRLFAIAVPVALLVFICLNPNIWHSPFYGLCQFLWLNTHRETVFNLTTVFFGYVYDMSNPLPWYNSLVWIFITVPVGILFLFVYAVMNETIRVFPREQETDSVSVESGWEFLLLFLNFALLPVIRMIPGTPVHDGVRLFIACFPFLGIMAAIGAVTLWNGADLSRKIGEQMNRRRRALLVRRFLVIAIYMASLFNLFWYAPQWLSFYNFAIGGLKGADQLGMNPTYFWDGLDAEGFQWLNEHTDFDGIKTGRKEKIFFIYPSIPMLRFYEKSGLLRNTDYGNSEPENKEDYHWYVYQNCRDIVLPEDHQFLRLLKPAFAKYIRKGGFGPWDLGQTPVLLIYDVRQLQQLEKGLPVDKIPDLNNNKGT